jgi:hypothetical protein
MSQAKLITDMSVARPERPLPLPLVVMIEIPELKTRSTKRTRRTTPRYTHIVRYQDVRPRRRLRRKIRLASIAVMALVPILSACTLGWSNRPDRIIACSLSDPLPYRSERDDPGNPARASLETEQARPATVAAKITGVVIEPTVVMPRPATEAAVVFSGYVLPDDSREDLLHEGS